MQIQVALAMLYHTKSPWRFWDFPSETTTLFPIHTHVCMLLKEDGLMDLDVDLMLHSFIVGHFRTLNSKN